MPRADQPGGQPFSSGKLRGTCEEAGLAYVAVIPCDSPVTLPSGSVIRADTRGGTRKKRPAVRGNTYGSFSQVVAGDGFEPSKAKPTVLQTLRENPLIRTHFGVGPDWAGIALTVKIVVPLLACH
jgi:hypothetical protein